MPAIELANIAAGIGGFVINGPASSGNQRVAGAGDVNGDGLADLILGAPIRNTGGNSCVFFGKTSRGAIDLAAIASGSGGFVINGKCAGDWSGPTVVAGLYALS